LPFHDENPYEEDVGHGGPSRQVVVPGAVRPAAPRRLILE